MVQIRVIKAECPLNHVYPLGTILDVTEQEAEQFTRSGDCERVEVQQALRSATKPRARNASKKGIGNV